MREEKDNSRNPVEREKARKVKVCREKINEDEECIRGRRLIFDKNTCREKEEEYVGCIVKMIYRRMYKRNRIC